MFCPHCRSEYRPGFTRCVDCDADLVDHLSEYVNVDADQEEGQPAIIFVTSNAYEAALIKSLLEASGVRVWPFDENLARINSFYATAIGGIKLAVDASQAELAREVLVAYRGGGESPALGRITPFTSSEEHEAAEDRVQRAEAEDQCPLCEAPLKAGTTVCSQCGYELT